MKCSFDWKHKQNYLDAKYYDWRPWFILFKPLISTTLTSPRTVLFHVRKSSIAQFKFFLLWSQRGDADG
jgi:hypothetical protein